MSPYREACAQMEQDQKYQALLDWLRNATLQGTLFHADQLTRGQTDPYYRLNTEMLEVAAVDGWSKVFELIAQVQREREQKAA